MKDNSIKCSIQPIHLTNYFQYTSVTKKSVQCRITLFVLPIFFLFILTHERTAKYFISNVSSALPFLNRQFEIFNLKLALVIDKKVLNKNLYKNDMYVH